MAILIYNPVMTMRSALSKAIANKRSGKYKTYKLEGIKPPLSPQVTYRKILQNYLNLMNEQIERRLFPLLTEREPEFYTDTANQDLRAVLKTIEDNFVNNKGFAQTAAHYLTKAVNAQNKKRMQAAFEKSFGIKTFEIVREEKIEKALEQSIKKNIALIKTIPEEHFKRIRATLSRGVLNGHKASDIRSKIREDFGVSDRRARFIARDQTAKLNSNLTEIRSINVGSKGYHWIGRGRAEGERPMHMALNNKYIAWDKKPVTNPQGQHNHAGEDYNCRCYARPVIAI